MTDTKCYAIRYIDSPGHVALVTREDGGTDHKFDCGCVYSEPSPATKGGSGWMSATCERYDKWRYE